jgi:hypothetical protein
MNHRNYFQRFQLNVEQYGEILGADALGLKKMGDAQPSYDLEGDKTSLIDVLKAHSIDTSFLNDYKEDEVYIEVKSKLIYTNTGRATVIHCHPNKIHGAKRANKEPRPMSHMLIVLAAPGPRAPLNTKNKTDSEEGQIELAVLLTHAEVVELLESTKAEKPYVNVDRVRKNIAAGHYVVLTSVLNAASLRDF